MSSLVLFLTVFLACSVEAVEALTIVLAAGTSRHWGSAVQGTLAALVALAAVVAVLGPAVGVIPLGGLRLVVGALLLVFGLQWLRKAIMRGSGYKALHDEAADLRRGGRRRERRRGGRPRRGPRLVRLHPVLQGRASSKGSKWPSSWSPSATTSGTSRWRCSARRSRSPWSPPSASRCARRWPRSRRTP